MKNTLLGILMAVMLVGTTGAVELSKARAIAMLEITNNQCQITWHISKAVEIMKDSVKIACGDNGTATVCASAAPSLSALVELKDVNQTLCDMKEDMELIVKSLPK